jgi:putative zinc finger/helix-turn-helix YgiT family protein
MLTETNCLECGSEMQRHVEDVPFDPSLPGVVLEGVSVYRCPNCDNYEVEIPHLEELHRAIALHLVRQSRRLQGPEVRFLRKWLGWSGQDFARRMGVTAETVSRWENEREPTGGTSDRLLRLMVLFGKPVSDYSLDRLAEISDIHAGPPAEPARFAPTRDGWRSAA